MAANPKRHWLHHKAAIPLLAIAITATLLWWVSTAPTPHQPAAVPARAAADGSIDAAPGADRSLPGNAADTATPNNPANALTAPGIAAPGAASTTPDTALPTPPDSLALAATLSPGHIPAEALVPAPAEHWTPPRPVEPPNPATHPPSKNNPGGVDGDRPPREPGVN